MAQDYIFVGKVGVDDPPKDRPVFFIVNNSAERSGEKLQWNTEINEWEDCYSFASWTAWDIIRDYDIFVIELKKGETMESLCD